MATMAKSTDINSTKRQELKDDQAHDARFEEIIAKFRANDPKFDAAVITKAYNIAKRVHALHKRKSGEPYITHPLEVASILADFKLDEAAVFFEFSPLASVPKESGHHDDFGVAVRTTFVKVGRQE